MSVARDVLRDAARWRLSRIVYPRLMDDSYGYFCVRGSDEVKVGLQPHPVTKETAVNSCVMGKAATEGDAIDSMVATLVIYANEGFVLPPEISAIIDLWQEGLNAWLNG